MLITDFDFELPAELIAQTPLNNRADSRMLAVNRRAANWRDCEFRSFPDFIEPNDVVVLNNTKVFPARLVGTRAGFAGKIELFLVAEIARNKWQTLARPARRLQSGTELIFGDANENLRAVVREKQADGRIVVEFDDDQEFDRKLEKIGRTPLPPYIERAAEPSREDRERYQTVYAKQRGAIAAPTAGLHFTPEILDRVRARGATIAEITLHVGYGTFEPVRVAELSQHKVAPEQTEISSETAAVINRAKAAKSRIVAVGTTTTRALENATNADGIVEAGKRAADLTITPGYRFKTVDALLTNFHLPQSSLLVLISTFAGHDLTMNAYAHAVAAKYRFYSYGDCMLIV